MNDERLMKVLVAPHISEKSSRVGELHNQVTFKVLPDATKPEIRAAVEKLFEVKVESVTTANFKGKTKGFGRVRGKRSDWKKAYVRLAEGQDIDFASTD